jgi:hypothetical protein
MLSTSLCLHIIYMLGMCIITAPEALYMLGVALID